MNRRACLTALSVVATLAVTLLPGQAAPAAPAPARADTERVVWLCRPGQADNPCEIGLDTTYQRADGTAAVRTLARPAPRKRPVDCFYVYPTVSNQVTPTATKAKDPEIRSIAKYQAARFSSLCRVFAPVYRQATLVGIATLPLGSATTAYADVRQAWRQYLRRDNAGRGVVLIGHSQGTLMLRRLIADEIDPDPQARRRLVSAVLLGGNVTTPVGKVQGGDFANIPLCTRPGQIRCVVAYSTYASDPLPVSFFGNTNTDVISSQLGFRNGRGMEVACTDPGVLSGSRKPVAVTVPSEPFAPGPIQVGITYSTLFDVPTAETTWVAPPDRFQGSCQEINGSRIFRYDPVTTASRRPPEFPPTWGTHLFDVNLGLEKLLTIVRTQTRTYLR